MARLVRFSSLFAMTAVVASCATGESVPRICSDAEQKFSSCGLSAPEGFEDLCEASPDSVGEILELQCDELAQALDDLGKSDLFGFSRGEGEPCSFNVQCDSDEGLVCRPTSSTATGESVPHTCQPYGRDGDFCDDASDCVRGDPCASASGFGAGACVLHDRGGH
jgi:hypothetical protein